MTERDVLEHEVASLARNRLNARRTYLSTSSIGSSRHAGRFVRCSAQVKPASDGLTGC